MARRDDRFYFDNLNACAQLACEASALLSEVMGAYDPDDLPRRIDQMHAIEQQGDERRHELLDALVTAFITPIDREDMAQLSSNLDDVTDLIEGVLQRLYYDNVRELTPGAIEMAEMLARGCDEMRALIAELPQFKRSKTLHEHVISINTVEELADAVFVRTMRDLHTNEPDLLRVISLREIYQHLEYCVDACEHVGDLVDAIVMRNS